MISPPVDHQKVVGFYQLPRHPRPSRFQASVTGFTGFSRLLKVTWLAMDKRARQKRWFIGTWLARLWFPTFFIFTPTWRNDPIDQYFWNGLKPPTSWRLSRYPARWWNFIFYLIFTPILHWKMIQFDKYGCWNGLVQPHKPWHKDFLLNTSI